MKKTKIFIPLATIISGLSIISAMSCQNTKKEPDKVGNSLQNSDDQNNPNQKFGSGKKQDPTSQEIEKFKKEIVIRNNFFNEIRTLKSELVNENAKYKYEIIFDQIDSFLEQNSTFTQSQYKELIESNTKLKNDLENIKKEASKLKKAEDVKPLYYKSETSVDSNNSKGKNQTNEPDYPELDAIKNSLKNNKQNSKNENNTVLNLQVENFLNIVGPKNLNVYKDDSYSAKQMNEIAQFVLNLIEKEKTSSTINKIKRIYDWITSTIKYATGNQKQYINPYDVFIHKVAVCGGISSLYKAMLDVIGVKSVMVTGWSSAGAHQWVMFYNEEKSEWVHSDATWGIVNSNYFMKSSSEISNDHRADEVLQTTFKEGQILYKYWHGLSVLGLSDNNQSKLEIPANVKNMPVKSISINVYSNKNMTHLHIGKNIEKIDFEIAPKFLQTYTVSDENKHFTAKDGILYTKDYSKLISTPMSNPVKSLILPKELSNIVDGKNSFSAPMLEKIIVEPGNYWFASYKGVLYNNDFSKLITVQGGKSKVIVHHNVKFNGNEFSSKPNLREVVLEEGITELVDFTFNGLSGLKTVYIPKSIEKIAEYAFNNLSQKITLVVPYENKLVKEYALKKNFNYVVQKNMGV
ncbi:Uncharacterised protein [Mycoplasmopsis bovigenitalium]|uniref:Transglutaminase-like domain-containing protein n=1 Tax=Mycoplasmopsis bovigenitalium TaxID=2112 RepID=A0A449A8C7_9BACT|nr:transglutaminase domain-containing protein [Mycoplasmopsis bovigenitalium]VEU60543.1 Uncharacterised protein [Mycoplasmopsis bovigenitalium]